MSGIIKKFELDSWGSLKLTTDKPYGTVVTEYYNVPKSIILKFLSKSTAPTVQDFDSWYSEYTKKRDAKNKDGPCKAICDFWTDPD
jgi:hypothetical protein